MEVTENGRSAPLLDTDTVWGEGGFSPVSKLKTKPVVAVGAVISVGLFVTVRVTFTTCGLLPPPIALKVSVPVYLPAGMPTGLTETSAGAGESPEAVTLSQSPVPFVDAPTV